MNELERWANLHLLMSAAAATLLTLAAERMSGDAARIPIYLTPTVSYFASVLYIAALLTLPNHTRLTASLCTCLVGRVLFFHAPQRGLTLVAAGPVCCRCLRLPFATRGPSPSMSSLPLVGSKFKVAHYRNFKLTYYRQTSDAQRQVTPARSVKLSG